MKRFLRRVLLAYGFLTVLPGLGKLTVQPGDTGGSTAYYPLAGLTLGALFIPFGLIPGISDLTLAVVLLAFTLFFTRALHADGLVDTFDGFLAGRMRREDILKVMKDSRLGALGFVGALSVYLLKIAFLYDILSAAAGAELAGGVLPGGGVFPAGVFMGGPPWHAVGRVPPVLAVVPALSRGGVPLACALFPYAGSREGLGRSFVETVTFRQPLVAFLLMEIFCCLAGSVSCLLLPPLLFLFWAGWGVLCTRKIGGVTGDTLGAGVELSELFALIVVRILSSRGGACW
jgi:adenosylcobinamide-GDP ribazoletransferase